MYISKTKLVLTGILAASLMIIVTADSQKDYLTQGQQPYTPSRLEWLELVLAKRYPALYAVEYPNGEGYNVKYVAVPKENTIRVEIYYASDMKAETLQDIIDVHKQTWVLSELTERGWQDWCKIKIHTESNRSLKKNNAGTQRGFEPVEKPY